MLDKLGFYAARKELVVNEKKSVVMHFGRSDVWVPVLKYRGSELAAVDSFKYLGMSFTRAVSMTAAAEQVVPAIQGGCLRVRKFVSEHGLVDRPHTLLWLAKAYVIPSSMYGSQIWGTGWLHEEGSGGGLSLADWSSLLFEACPGRGAYFLQLVCAEGVWSGASPVLLVSGSSAVL
jgi:hypothetical protein